jgi:hypothetical protein
MKAILLVLSLISINALAASETDSKKPMDPKMEAWTKAAAPGEEHKAIATLAGNWKYTMKFWETADGQAHESKGTATNKMILGGRFLHQEMKGKTMGMNFQGVGTIGYDNVRKQIETTWMDNMGTGITRGTGTYDPATKTITEKGTMADPMAPNGNKDYRAVTKIDKNTFTMEMFTTDEKGKEFKMMEIISKR